MVDCGNEEVIRSLGAEAERLDKMGDGLQDLILRSTNMSEEQKMKLTQEVARRQKAASDLRRLIIDLS
jgi:hypothetical protein